jgi:hypothetical protein
MKKIAYLIVAHTDPNILKRLIISLNSNADFYIHLDKKVERALFQTQFYDFENVYFINDNHWVQWAGFGIVAAQISLIKIALKSKQDYIRLVHLSGLDYPLMSNNKLYKYFSIENVEYISGYNITKSSQINQKKRVTRYHLFKNVQGRTNKAYKILGYLCLKLSDLLPFKKQDIVSIDGKVADIFFGSQFFAVTPAFAGYFLEVVKNNPLLVNYFKTSFAPDELFVQTIFFNSSFSDKADSVLLNKECDLHKLASLHYFEYTSSIKVLSNDDYETVMNSGKFFMRKVTTKKSIELINRIDLVRNQ